MSLLQDYQRWIANARAAGRLMERRMDPWAPRRMSVTPWRACGGCVTRTEP